MCVCVSECGMHGGCALCLSHVCVDKSVCVCVMSTVESSRASFCVCLRACLCVCVPDQRVFQWEGHQ